ncbi:hypothetical protein AGLY_008525 [Aphis glycines]|uniref:Uncharacterized protein n=1 Tax=Aphis glycines TaxID=307491 RepID=A0A6G0TK98_APHGL|nr:hypothetical protein AGLY_008525 [Aphis glycines]
MDDGGGVVSCVEENLPIDASQELTSRTIEVASLYLNNKDSLSTHSHVSIFINIEAKMLFEEMQKKGGQDNSLFFPYKKTRGRRGKFVREAKPYDKIIKPSIRFCPKTNTVLPRLWGKILTIFVIYLRNPVSNFSNVVSFTVPRIAVLMLLILAIMSLNLNIFIIMFKLNIIINPILLLLIDWLTSIKRYKNINFIITPPPSSYKYKNCEHFRKTDSENLKSVAARTRVLDVVPHLDRRSGPVRCWASSFDHCSRCPQHADGADAAGSCETCALACAEAPHYLAA